MGAGEHEKAERTLGASTAALWALSVVLTVVFLLFQRPLLMLFGASADTLPYALEYLNIYVLGTIFVMTALGLNGFITAQGKSGVAMKTVLIGAVVLTSPDGRVSRAARVEYDDAANLARLIGTAEQPAESSLRGDVLRAGELLYDLERNEVVARAPEGGTITGEFQDGEPATNQTP